MGTSSWATVGPAKLDTLQTQPLAKSAPKRITTNSAPTNSTGLPLGGRTPYITSKNRLRTPKLHIRDVPRTSENSLVRPKMDMETSCLQKKPAYIYQITWFMSRLRVGNSFILFIDHARTSHLTDFESFIDSQCHV